MAKRDTILEAIQAGGATKESLMEVAEVDAKGLASQFTYMRLMGNCPVMVPGEDGEPDTFKIVSAEEWQAIKADRAANSTAGSKLTPEERLEKAQTSHDKAVAAEIKTAKAADGKDDRKLDIRSEIAQLTSELRGIELDAAKDAVD